jgi:transposase
MNNGSKRTTKMTAGLDLGDKYSYLCLLDDESGELIEEGRLRTTPEAFECRFGSERPLKIAIEIGTHSPWVSRLLTECGHEVLVANPRKTRLIYGERRKTDKLDAQKLARLARVDPELLYPVKHRGKDSQAHLALVHSREALVRSRTQLINPGYEGRSSLSGPAFPNAPRRASTKRSPIRCPVSS